MKWLAFPIVVLVAVVVGIPLVLIVNDTFVDAAARVLLSVASGIVASFASIIAGFAWWVHFGGE